MWTAAQVRDQVAYDTLPPGAGSRSRPARMTAAVVAAVAAALVVTVACLHARGASLTSKASVVGLFTAEAVPASKLRGSSSDEDEAHHHEEVALTDTDEECSGYGENCTATKCCKEAGHQCFVKDAYWATCRRSCIPGPDPTASDGWPWSCDTLGPRAKGELVNCSKMGEDCSSSKCCADPGLQCYEKDENYAACRAVCHAGVDVTDTDPQPWSCNPLGHRALGVQAWVRKVCAPPMGACFKSECCSEAGYQCFEKDEYYGECRAECPEGWSCKTRGSRTPPAALTAAETQGELADWVADKCSQPAENCLDTQCCAGAGNRCYQKNSTWAACKGSCAPGPDLYDNDSSAWSCEPLGMRTPGWAMDPWKEGKDVAKWVGSKCAAEGAEDCSKSMCCKDVGRKCYRKNDGWAACLSSCTPGHMPGDDDGNWTCEELGPVTMRPWHSPSLFCLSVIQPFGYEKGLVAAQMGAGVGIFACDEFSLFSTEQFFVGVGPLGAVSTVPFVPAKVVQSKDGTAGNAEIFMHMWDAVRSQSLWQATDWTVKVDPDAVLLPERLRWHLKPHTGTSSFVVNCAKPYMPEGPMMFGALEAISRKGLETYLNKAGDCINGLDWKSWGEDLFLNHCFDKLGVARVNDFNIYSDGVCRGVDCKNPDAAAFHPKKDINSWFGCLNETKTPNPRTTTNAPQWFKDYMASYAR